MSASPAPFEARPHPSASAWSAIGVALLLTSGFALTMLLTPAQAGPPLTAEVVTLRINPNTATRAELMLLPGIGPALSENIVAYRDEAKRSPAFSKPEDLDSVYRIGPVTVERLAPLLTFTDEAPSTTDPADAAP